MSALLGEERHAFARRLPRLAHHCRRKIMHHGGPDAVDPLTAVEGVFAGHAFSPALYALAVDRNQKNAAAISAAEAGLKKVDQRHLNFAECDGFNFHGVSSFHDRDTEKVFEP